MPLSATHDRERLKTWVVCLTMACPFSQANPADCFLCSIRTKTITDRVQWVDTLPHEKLRQIVGTHSHCLDQKQQ